MCIQHKSFNIYFFLFRWIRNLSRFFCDSYTNLLWKVHVYLRLVSFCMILFLLKRGKTKRQIFYIALVRVINFSPSLEITFRRFKCNDKSLFSLITSLSDTNTEFESFQYWMNLLNKKLEFYEFRYSVMTQKFLYYFDWELMLINLSLEHHIEYYYYRIDKKRSVYF